MRAVLSLACVASWAAEAAAEPCQAPDWFANRRVKPAKGHLLGYGVGDTVDEARIAVRREIGAQMVKRQFKKIASSKEFRESVNTKIYNVDELRKATGLAIGTSILQYERVKADQVCRTAFVALQVSWDDAIRQYEQDPQFTKWIRHALQGTLNTVEEERIKKQVQGVEDRLRKAQNTVEKITLLLSLLRGEIALEEYQREPLNARLKEARRLIQVVREQEWEDERAKAFEALAKGFAKIDPYVSGVEHLTRRDLVGAANAFRVLAGEGDVWAQLTYGMMVLEGKGVRRDDAVAFDWLKKSANQGNPLAQMIVGMLYFSGKGVKADSEAAFQWLKKAVAQGWVCQVELGLCRKSL